MRCTVSCILSARRRRSVLSIGRSIGVTRTIVILVLAVIIPRITTSSRMANLATRKTNGITINRSSGFPETAVVCKTELFSIILLIAVEILTCEMLMDLLLNKCVEINVI